MSDIETHIARPILDGRKTLLIGLGSTGAKVCNQVLERLSWTVNSPESVPWFRAVVMETAPVAADRPLHQHARFLHLKIDREDYANLISNPQNWQPTLDFSSWNIPDLTRSSDAIVDGANNLRILGRLALLFPNNLTRVQTAIAESLSDLQSLQNKEASEWYSKGTGENVDVALTDTIFVYVVGTLCGGTASGCFLDLGYLLRTLGYNDVMKTTGIFLLPSPQERNPTLLANAYAALVELNHYSSDQTRYSAQYANSPGRPTLFPPGSRPYEYLYLAQTRGATAAEYAQLLTTCADYVYTDMIGSSAKERDGKRTNIAGFFVQRDYWGATQKFFTFGLSTIEFPAAKVARACALRLAKTGFQNLIGEEYLSETSRQSRMERIPLLQRERMIDALLTRQNGSLKDLLQQALNDSRSQMEENDTAISLIRERLNASFDGSSQVPDAQLPPRLVPQTVEENARTVSNALRESIRSVAQSFLTADAAEARSANPLASNAGTTTASAGAVPGIRPLIEFLKALEETLNQNISHNEADTIGGEVMRLSGEADAAQEQIRECREDFWLRVTLHQKSGVRRYIEEFEQAMFGWLEQRLRMDCLGYCRQIYGEALAQVSAIRRRLDDARGGLLTEVRALVGQMEDLFVKTDVPSGTSTDGWSRAINGTELFTPGQTVEEEYWKCLRQTAASQRRPGDDRAIELALASEVAGNYITSVLPDLLADSNEVRRFDNKSKTADYDTTALMRLAEPARSVFTQLRTRSIVSRLLDYPESGTLLANARERSQYFLDFPQGGIGHPRHYGTGNKTYGFVFFNAEEDQNRTFRRQLEGAGLLDNGVGALHIADRHQLLVLREQGAFSLGTIGNLKDEETSFWRNSYQGGGGLSSYHSRGDVAEWVTWSRTDEEARTRIRNLFLVGVALGVIEFVSANEYRFTYPPRNPADPGATSFRPDLNQAAQVLKTNDLANHVALRISEVRKKFGATEAVARLDTFIRTHDGKFTEGEQKLSSQDLLSYLLDTIHNDTELEAAYNAMYPDEVGLSYLKPDETGREAYYCPHCGSKLGYNANALYTYISRDGRIVRERRCAYCQQSL